MARTKDAIQKELSDIQVLRDLGRLSGDEYNNMRNYLLAEQKALPAPSSPLQSVDKLAGGAPGFISGAVRGAAEATGIPGLTRAIPALSGYAPGTYGRQYGVGYGGTQSPGTITEAARFASDVSGATPIFGLLSRIRALKGVFKGAGAISKPIVGSMAIGGAVGGTLAGTGADKPFGEFLNQPGALSTAANVGLAALPYAPAIPKIGMTRDYTVTTGKAGQGLAATEILKSHPDINIPYTKSAVAIEDVNLGRQARVAGGYTGNYPDIAPSILDRQYAQARAAQGAVGAEKATELALAQNTAFRQLGDELSSIKTKNNIIGPDISIVFRGGAFDAQAARNLSRDYKALAASSKSEAAAGGYGRIGEYLQNMADSADFVRAPATIPVPPAVAKTNALAKVGDLARNILSVREFMESPFAPYKGVKPSPGGNLSIIKPNPSVTETLLTPGGLVTTFAGQGVARPATGISQQQNPVK